MAFRNTPKFFILLFLMVILCKNSAPNRSPSVKDILEEIASSFGDKQLSVLHPQNGTDRVEQSSVDVTNKLFNSGRQQHTFRATENYDRIENVELQPPEDDILYQQSENLNSKPMSNYFQFNSTSDYSDLDGSPNIKDKLDKINISSGVDGSILSIFNQSSDVSIRPNKKAIESTTDQYLFTENINDLSTENMHNSHTTTLINESLTNFSNQEPVSTTQSSEFSRFVHLNSSDNTFSIDNATKLDDRQSGVLTENIANVSDHIYKNNSSKERVSKSIETVQNDSSKQWNENDDLLLSIETRVGGPQVTFHENINPDNREISFDIEIATDIFDDDTKPNKSEIVYDSKTISESKFNLARFTRSLNNESDRNNTDHVSDNSTHSNDTHESRSNQEHEMKIDTEEIVSNLFDAGENPLDLLPELDFLESEKLKEAATAATTATSTNVDSSFIFETRSESVPATMSNEEKSVFDVFHVASRFDLNKNRNVSKTETASTDIGSRSNTMTNLNRTDKIENMSQSGGTTEREKMVVLEPGQNVEISVIQTSPVNKITTESITHSTLSSTTNNNRTDENSTPSNNDFGILNLADSMENSEASSSSHEVLLKTSSKIKEAFVITSKNNLIFFKEKRFDPAHRLRKFLHHSDLNNMKTLYHEQQRRAENLSNSVGHNRTLTDGIVHNANVSQTEEQICSDDCNKLGDSTSDFYFQTDSDYNKNRNERDTQNDNFDPHSLSSNGNGGSVGKKKINIYKELQQITAKKQLDKVSSINDLMSDPSSLSVTTNQEQPQTHSSVFCNFETPCEWKWDSKSGFRITSAVELKNLNVGPKFDANNRTNGHFLFLQVGQTTRELSVVSPAMAPSGEACSLDLWLHQANMNASIIKVVGEKMDTKPTQWIVYEMYGNSYKSWQHYNFMIGRVSQQFRILIEVLPHLSPAHVAIDNVGLVDCWPEPAIHNQCVNPRQYHCTTTNVCVNVSQVCDLIHDCNHGEDEQDCEKIPFGARCDFEDGWCGWQNDVGRSIPWTRNHGSTSMNRTAAQREHTYINNTGHYLLVDMFVSREKGFAATASLSSVIFNPPPSVHSNESSKYYNSCLIRFYYHLHGYHKSGLGLMITELKPKENITSQIWWSYRDNGDNWIRGVVRLPNITNRYYLQFEAKKGLRSLSAVGIDNVSLSPECFGLNIPVNELNGYNYWNPLQCVDPCFKETHKDFINKTYYEFTTCGARGRFGPTSLNCTKAYNNTPVDVEVLQKSSSIFKGVQKWIVPGDGYYTFIAKGASGGRGSSGMGSSRGAVVRAVFELTKGERLHILIGQEGMNACIKSLGSSFNTSCQSLINDNSENLTGVRGVKNMKLKDGGGGGGGATYVFLLQRKNNISVWVPLLVAAGGGGIGIGKFIDSDLQHGQAINMSKKPYSGQTKDKEKSSGAGGGYYSDSGRIISIQNGQALQDGGTGGEACYESRGGEGSGGFGGGGGGCTMGGGGGGYAGGNAYTPNSKNGEGGTSFISPKSVRVYSEAWGGHHTGPGSLLIIPVNNECGCDYRCLALDEYRAKVTCICPQDWFLGTDNITCMLRDSPNDSNILIGLLIVIIIIVIIMLSIIFFALYNRYQHNKTEIMRRKMLSGPELQLNRLRMQSDSMMTEYNPSYEFGGVVYTLKDLHEIPRNQLRLVKALGQGAFGEVYQGFYKARQNDAVEMPVAVKTLPEMSTQQAEMDFLMEALIMSKFNHPNIVHFIGVCFDKHPRFIVLELLAGGDLKNFLRESRPKPERSSPLTMKDLVLISIDVAKGCKYMEDNRFIHRDIAARNCLLTTKGPGRVVKIADFGMSRDIYRSDYYRKGGKAMLPIKWMPPEAFLDGIFTSKTDVWSFGVLLWEIMSMGYMPYTGCANRQVMQLVTSGGRLEPPSNCPGPVYGIMTQCWHPNPEQRPTFSQLLERLGYCIQDPDVISNPLPVFTKAPSAERDATVMRPKNPDDSYLQFPGVPQQFAHNADYLVPTPTSGPDLQISPHDGSVEKLLNDGSNDGNSDSWETSFMLPQSKSTQPLLQDNVNDTVNSNEPTVQNLINIDTPQLTPTATSPTESNLMNHVNHNHNNNIKAAVTTLSENNTSVMNIKSGVSLDASTLIQQTANGQKKPYVNVMPNNDKTYTTQNGPYTIDNVPHTNNYVNNKKSGYLNNDSEISC